MTGAHIDRITEVLRAQFPTAPRLQIDYAAKCLVAALHLTEILVKEGETPPLYAISGWMRGATTSNAGGQAKGSEAYLAGYAEALENVMHYLSMEAVYADGSLFKSSGARVTRKGRAIAKAFDTAVAEFQVWKDNMSSDECVMADADRCDES